MQTAGGFFEAASGVIIAGGGSILSAGTASPFAIAGGGILFVDGGSNFVGGLSQVWNGLSGSGEGDTLNFVKNTFVAVSPESGGRYYNYYQMGLAGASFGMGLAGSADDLARVADDVVEGTGEGLELYRRTANVGEFSHLEVPMQLREVKRLAEQAGIGLDAVKVKIIRDPEMIRLPHAG